MDSKILIASITIPNYIREIELSKAQRPKYFEWDGNTIKAKGKKIWKRLIKVGTDQNKVKPQDLINTCYLVGFKGIISYSLIRKIEDEKVISIEFKQLTLKQEKIKSSYKVCEKIINPINNSTYFEPIIANPTQVRKPKKHIISGQSTHVGISEFIRTKVVNALHKMYYNKFITIPSNTIVRLKKVLNKNYPLIIEVEVFDTIKNFYDNSKDTIGKRWDVGNRVEPYMKTFLDFLSRGYNKDSLYFDALIEDDDRLHVTSANNGYFTPITESEERKLVFKIYKDKRKIFQDLF